MLRRQQSAVQTWANNWVARPNTHIAPVLTLGVMLLLGTAGPLVADTPVPGSIVGRITDSAGEAIGGVTVTIMQLNRQVVSDDNGGYRLSQIPGGTYVVSYVRLGYAPQTREVVVEEEKSTTIDIVLRSSAIQVAAVAVTATPRAADPQISAPDVAVLYGRDKERKQQTSLGSSLEHLPGVANIATGRQAGKPVIRGLSGSRIRVLNDGIVMDYQQYGVRHWASVDPFLAERLEVVRGASSVLYGSDALGGAVNVLPRRIPQSIDGSAFLRGNVLGEYSSNNNEFAGGLALEGGAGGLGWTGSLMRRSAGNMRTPNAPTAEETGVGTDPRFTGVLDHTDYDQLSGTVGLGYHTSYGMFAAHYTGWRDEHNFLLHTGGGIGQNLENDVAQGKAVLALKGNWLVRPTLSYLRNLRQSNSADATRDELPHAVAVEIELESFTGRFEAEHSGQGSLAGRAGAEIQYQSQESRGVEPLVPSARIWNLGAFLYEEARLGKWSLSFGGRFDFRTQRAEPDQRLSLPDYRIGETEQALEQSYRAITGSAGAAYRASQNLTVATNVGIGFRAPGIFELHVYGIHGGVAAFQIGNPSLDREVLLNTDVSLRWRSSAVEARLTGYRNGVDNYIYLVNTEEIDSISGFPIMRTVQGDAQLWGMDASLQAQLLAWLRLNGLFRTVVGKNVDTGEKLPLLPATAMEGGFELNQQALWRLQNPYVCLGVRFVGDKKAAGRYEPFWQFDSNPHFGVASTERYVLLRAEIGFDLPLAKSIASVNLVVHNLLDEVYRDFLDTYKGYALSPGRDIRIRVNLPFGKE